MMFQQSTAVRPWGIVTPRSRWWAVWGPLVGKVLFAITLVARPAAGQQSDAARALVLDRVTVVDVEQGKLVPDQRVVIVGNRIWAVGSSRKVRPPKAAQIVDAEGKYVIPGLWDMHTHAGVAFKVCNSCTNPDLHVTADMAYLLFIANGVTGFRDAWSDIPLAVMVQWRREILAGTRVGPPRQLLSGVAIDEDQMHACGKERHDFLSGHACIASDTAAIGNLVRSLKAAGADMLKTYSLGPEMYFKVAAAARREGLRFGGHAETVSPFDAADSGVSIIDHPNRIESNIIDSLCFDPIESTAAGCGKLAERFRRTNSWSVPTLTIYTSKYLPEDLVFERHVSANGELRFTRAWQSTEPQHYVNNLLRKAVTNFWDDFTYNPMWLHNHIPLPVPTPPPATSSDPRWDYPFGAWNFFYLKTAMEVGLPILAGGDTRPEESGFLLHAELATLVDRGLTPLAALQAATLNPAKMLRGTDSLGTVATGKLADLVLLDANPLDDITNTTMIRAVVANGRYFDRAALDGLLAEIRNRVK